MCYVDKKKKKLILAIIISELLIDCTDGLEQFILRKQNQKVI